MNRRDYLARLKEPSTYAGLAILLNLFGVPVTPGAAELGINAAIGLAGFLAIIMKEKPAP